MGKPQHVEPSNDSIIAANRAIMTPDMLACNAVGGFSRDFWAEIDNQVLQLRESGKLAWKS
ncbi:hypothetical protein [Enterobacter roggenkampii]|uniref:hypothetical protein n=1 Tax=Enterobacter roggenkampii TaxID=1812935 RepID=UPI002542CD17|nr:hypothetical protein [Enterobacter roggenkampii]WIJ78693.1 hypothetical protein OI980_24480 [Enterobacter roggenkampii]